MTNRTLPQQLADRKSQIMEQSIEIHELNERVEELVTDLKAAKEDNARLRALVEDAYSEGYDNGLDSDYDWQNSYARKVLEGEGGE